MKDDKLKELEDNLVTALCKQVSEVVRKCKHLDYDQLTFNQWGYDFRPIVENSDLITAYRQLEKDKSELLAALKPIADAEVAVRQPTMNEMRVAMYAYDKHKGE